MQVQPGFDVNARPLAPEKARYARDGVCLMVDDGEAAAVQERSVQQRHGHGPQHSEDHRQSNDRPVLAVERAFDIERGRQVGLVR